MADTTHKIYINRAHVFDEGVTWTTVAGLYPHAYVPEDAFTDLQAERDSAVEEANRLRTNRDRYPELMARVMAEKSMPLDGRIERLKFALADLSPDIARHQWEADEKPAFGEKYVRDVAGNDGEGKGRQWLASTPPHIKGLAEYIAAANPDTVAMLLTDLAATSARAEAAEAALARAYMAGRDDAANEVRDEYDLEAIRALTPPADLAARIAAMKGPGHE